MLNTKFSTRLILFKNICMYKLILMKYFEGKCKFGTINYISRYEKVTFLSNVSCFTLTIFF